MPRGIIPPAATGELIILTDQAKPFEYAVTLIKTVEIDFNSAFAAGGTVFQLDRCSQPSLDTIFQLHDIGVSSC